MIDRNNGEIHNIKSRKSALSSLEIKRVIILPVVAITGVVGAVSMGLLMVLNGMYSSIFGFVFLLNLFPGIKATLAINKNTPLWDARIQKITDFLRQK
jgi:hypothetical protein